jgi:CBS domain-containing protein
MPAHRGGVILRVVNTRSGTMNVKDVMTSDVVTVRPETPLKDVAAILTERRISGVPVVDETGRS